MDSVVPVPCMLAEGFQPTPCTDSTWPSGSWLPEGCLGVGMLEAGYWGGLEGRGGGSRGYWPDGGS